MPNKAKTLTLSNLKSDSGNFFKFVEETITAKSGNQYKVRIRKNVKSTDVTDLFAEITKRIDYCNKNNISFQMLNTYVFGVLSCFIDMPKINSADVKVVMDKEATLLEEFINLGIYEIVMEKIGQEGFDEVEKILSSIESEELLEMLGNEQVKNLLLNDKLEISDGENI